MKLNDTAIVEKIKNGAIGIIPSDTVYIPAATALREDVVERVYKVRKRRPEKPFIILISSMDELGLFDIKIDEKVRIFLENLWPAKVSVILPCPNEKFAYLHRGTNTLALRMPPKKDLLDLLKQTGPLIAPSANPEGLPPAKTIAEAKAYFGNKVDFYIDQGTLDALPSTLINFDENGEVKILRQGEYKIAKIKKA